ncbi:MAG: ABC transporter substrate-binding protein [Firmicutes bacterium]|nr:ABC transporter substrate-binding protein [Bacillota bacterium]
MKKNWLRTLSLVLCLALCFGLIGCGGPGEVEEGNPEQVVIATDVDLKALDPMGNWSGACYYIYWTCYDRLLGYDYETGEYLPELATSWEVSEDGMEYIFHLRDDVKWHDGTQFTAKDVVYTVKRGIETSCGNYPSVDHAEAIDDFTVKYIMKNPNSLVLDKQWIGDAAVIQDGCGDDVATNIMGTGAYKVKEWHIGEHLIIEANPDYWGEQPQIKEIKFVTMPEANARLMAVQAGDVHAAKIGAANLKAAQEDENITIYAVPSVQMNYLGMNHTNEYLSNKLVRQAIYHAINKQDIIDGALEGQGTVADTMVPASIQGHAKDIKGYEYDVEKAKALLAEAGYADGFELELTYVTGGYDIQAQIIQAQLKEIGIDVKLDGKESAAAAEKINGGQSQLNLGNRGSSNADYYLNIMHSARLTDGRNVLNFSNPDFDACIDNAINATDTEARTQEYIKAQQLIHDEVIVIPLYTGMNFNISPKNLAGIQLLPTSGTDFGQMYWVE